VMDQVYVREDGCIRLGPDVTCDGFEPGAALRIQTHIHTDHMKEFETSKGQQNIVVTPETLRFLISDLNGDLPHRSNVIQNAPDGVYRSYNGVEVAFFGTGHFPGCAMASVRCGDGRVYAYTSDFSWPLTAVPHDVDVLVVDATYGNSAYVRQYRPREVYERFARVVRDELHDGRVLFVGVRGRLHAAMQLLNDDFQLPFLLTRSAARSLDVFESLRGFKVRNPYMVDSDEGRKLLRSGERCFIFAEPRDRHHLDQLHARRRIYLSPYMVPRQEPVAVYDNLIRIALTDHADFPETVELIRAIQPKAVIADGSRGGDALHLAEHVRSTLGIPATSKLERRSRLWGGRE
jgi:Cft2 family RNA processing exonuclease